MARPRKAGAKQPQRAEGKTGGAKRRIEQYDHKGQQRKNNPPVGLVTEATDRDAPRQRYAYDPHLDPALTWAGKAEHTSFEVPTVSLHVHERIDPKTIMDAVRRKNGAPGPVQGSLFESAEENPPLREAIDFYQHAHAWSNRLIAGDSLLVTNSLLEKEALRQQARRQGRQRRRPDPGARDDPGLPRHLGAGDPLVPDVRAGPAAPGACRGRRPT